MSESKVLAGHQEEALASDPKIFGFFVYLMTDLIIFAVLFATFIVLRNSTFGGPTGGEIFNISIALTETVILLTSSFTCALGLLTTFHNKRKQAIFWFLLTFALGISFLIFEISEFSDFVEKGHSWQRSAFLSSFFTLVGTHGLHVTLGLLWMAVVMVRIWMGPLTPLTTSRIFRMALFWHFLDFIWIFIFTIVYGMGHLL
jgi:cytochrome o ubiquinol oxidase subunit III